MLKRVGKAGIALFSGQAITAVTQLLLVPLFLRSWTTVIYGEWLALFSLVGYLANLNLGLDNAAVNKMTKAYSQGDLIAYKHTQHTAIMFYMVISTVGIILVATITGIFPVTNWLGLVKMGPSEARLVTVFLSAQILLSMPFGVIINTYRTRGDLATTVWINNFRRLIDFIVVACAVAFGSSPSVVAAALLISLIVVILGVLIDLKRRFPEILPGISFADKNELHQLFGPSFHFLVITFAVTLSEQGAVLIISAFLGGAAVAVFVTTRTLVNLIRQVLGMVNSAVWPDVTILESQDKLDRLRLLQRVLTGVSLSITIGYSVFLWIQGGSVIRAWTNGELIVDQILLVLVIVYKGLQSAWTPSSLIAAATNKHGLLSRAYLFSSVLGLIIGLLLIRHLGILAVPIGLLAGDVLACYHFVIKDACQIVKTSYLAFAGRLWSSIILIFCVTFALGWWVANVVEDVPQIYLHWIVILASSMLVSMLGSWLLWLSKEERSAAIMQIATRIRNLSFVIGSH